jgi:hypothetical protein
MNQIPAMRRENGYERLSMSCGSSRSAKSSNGPISPTGFRVARRLQGTQKVENVLLLIVAERIEISDDYVRFRCVKGKETPAAMRLDRFAQVRGSPVMQEEQPLSQSPQRGSAKFPGARLSLRDSIGQPWAHIMDQQVGEEIHRLVAQRSDRGIARVERGRMAESAPGIAEQASTSCD